MAYLSYEFCNKCQVFTKHVNRDCVTCVTTKKEKIEAENLKKISELSPDEKLIYLFKKLEKIETNLGKIESFVSINQQRY